MKENKKSSNVKSAIFLTFLGAVLLITGYIFSEKIMNDNLIEVTAKVVSYNNGKNGKLNVMCKYIYQNSDYTFICHTINQGENDKYPIDTQEKVKINKSDPGKIAPNNMIYIYYIIKTIGLLFLILAIFYLIKDIIRRLKK